jgi:hypothetical protein
VRGGVGFEERMADSRWSMVQNETAAGKLSVAMDGPTLEKTPFPSTQVGCKIWG